MVSFTEIDGIAVLATDGSTVLDPHWIYIFSLWDSTQLLRASSEASARTNLRTKAINIDMHNVGMEEKIEDRRRFKASKSK